MRNGESFFIAMRQMLMMLNELIITRSEAGWPKSKTTLTPVRFWTRSFSNHSDCLRKHWPMPLVCLQTDSMPSCGEQDTSAQTQTFDWPDASAHPLAFGCGCSRPMTSWRPRKKQGPRSKKSNRVPNGFWRPLFHS